ncbi:MAG: 2'-5' RNA ligase family protein [Acidobacteriota bacterium]
MPSPLARMYREALRAAEHLRPSVWPRARRFEIAYAILVNDEVHQFVNRMQTDVVRTCRVRPLLHETPHITLKLGFRVSAFEPFEAYLETLARETDPFEIGVRDVGFFDEGIIFLDVEPNAAFERLRHRILRDLSERHGIEPYAIEGDQFHPHVTVAFGLSSHDVEHAKAVFGGAGARFHFMLEALGLLCQTSTQWVTRKRANLTGSPAKPS